MRRSFTADISVSNWQERLALLELNHSLIWASRVPIAERYLAHQNSWVSVAAWPPTRLHRERASPPRTSPKLKRHRHCHRHRRGMAAPHPERLGEAAPQRPQPR